MKLVLITFLVFSLGCSKVSSVRNSAKKIVTGGGELKTDLSTLSAEDVIKTKYDALKFVCTYNLNVEKVVDGSTISESKAGNITWDLVKNTALAKTISDNTQILNLTFGYELQMIVTVDTKFNTHLNLKPTYQIKTVDAEGKVVTNVSTDGAKTSIALEEKNSTMIVDLVTGPTSVSGINKINMNCTYQAEVKSIYK